VTGRLYGPATAPQTLWMLRQVAALIEGALPLIGSGGIHCTDDALAMLDAGAVAVQVDSYIWKDPTGFVRMARAVTHLSKDKKTGLPNSSPVIAAVLRSIAQQSANTYLRKILVSLHDLHPDSQLQHLSDGLLDGIADFYDPLPQKGHSCSG